jgi:hypothetical protein
LLLEAYRPGDVFDPWLQPPWEYMHVHPLVRGLDRSRFGVAEDDHGRVIAIVHNEHDPAVAYLQRRPGDDRVIEPLLDWSTTRARVRWPHPLTRVRYAGVVKSHRGARCGREPLVQGGKRSSE